MNYMQQYLVEEYVEEYEAGRISRRELVRIVSALAGSAALASSILDAVPVLAEDIDAAPHRQATGPGVTVSPDDPSITAYPVTVPGRDGAALFAYLSTPKGQGPFPGVLVIHENQGMLEHFKDVTRRYAKLGYTALTVDLLSRAGGTDSMPNAVDRAAALGGIPVDQQIQDLLQGLEYLKNLPRMRPNRIGVTGFCYGGGLTWRLATAARDLAAAVPYYGANPPLDQVPNIGAAVFAIYAGLDQRLNAGIPEIERAMRAANKTFEYKIFPNVLHGFFNDTRGETMDLPASREAWSMTLAWFDRYLKR